MNTETSESRTPLTEEEKRLRRAAYNRRYYEQNGDTLKERKVARYQKDQTFRDRVKKDSASRRTRGTDHYTTVACGGVDAHAFRAVVLAERLDVSISTINFWQKHHTLPDTPFRTQGGYRLYTSEMIEAVRAALSAYPRPNKGDKLFSGYVAERWTALGVPL